ncbi:MAG TPA: hypothetical protein VLX92_12005 [Kofleriaceae bacterium]|nr:hypothetical protein [Kofleriaceae bacterium]
MQPEQDPFTAIDLAALDDVIGGRHGGNAKKQQQQVMQGVAQLAQTLQSVGQNMAQAKAADGQNMSGMMQQLMSMRGGGGGGGGGRA